MRHIVSIRRPAYVGPEEYRHDLPRLIRMLFQACRETGVSINGVCRRAKVDQANAYRFVLTEKGVSVTVAVRLARVARDAIESRCRFHNH